MNIAASNRINNIMKDKEETIKEKLISYGMDIAKQIVIALVKAKLFPKKKETSEKNSVEKKAKKKKKRKIFRKIIFAALVNEFLIERLEARLVGKPNSKNFS